MNVSNMMRDIEQYKVSVVKGMFKLRQDDEKDNLEQKKEVIQQHKNGRHELMNSYKSIKHKKKR